MPRRPSSGVRSGLKSLKKRLNPTSSNEPVAASAADTKSQTSLPPPSLLLSQQPSSSQTNVSVTKVPKSAVDTRNLWQAAWERLSLSERNLFEARTKNTKREAHAEDIISNVMKSSKTWCDDYEAAGWHIKRRENKDINIREKANSLIRSALSFKEVIDAGLKFDASGYGATAWSILSFGLTLKKLDQDQIDAISEASDFLAQVLARYAHIESQYRDQGVRDWENLEECIICVYFAILQYVAEVERSEQLGTMGRIGSAVTALTGVPLQQLKQAVDDKDRETGKWRTLIESQQRSRESKAMHEKAEGMLSGIHDISTNLSSLKETVITGDEDAILEWLSTTDTISKHETLRRSVTEKNPESGQWFLQSSNFSTWLSSPQTCLWLYGNSGCGKSCLCSTIIDRLINVCQQHRKKCLLHWYFDLNDSDIQDVRTILRSFLRTLSTKTKEFPPAIRQLSDDHRKGGSRPSATELLSKFSEIVPSLKEDVFLVLDSLDEYAENAGDVRRRDLLDMLRKLIGEGHDNLHILITSRYETDIATYLQTLIPAENRVNVEGPLFADLEKLFDYTMQSSPNLKDLEVATKYKVRERLIHGEQKNFRWAALNLDDLQLYLGNEESVLSALSDIPDNVEAIYTRVLANIDDHVVKYAQIAFEWLSVSKQPMTQAQLAKAAGIAVPSDINSICTSSMVASSREKPEEPETVRFAHSSVNEFLRSKKLQSSTKRTSRFFVSVDDAHAQIGNCCLLFLLEQGERPNPLLLYAAKHWYTHAKAVNESSVNEATYRALQNAIYDFFSPASSKSFAQWLRLADPDRRDSNIAQTKASDTFAGPLYYALLLGFEEISYKLINHDDVEVNGRGGREGSALQLAVHRGYTSIVSILLQKNANVNYEDPVRGSALYTAVVRGHTQIIDALLKANADVNKPGGLYGNALQAASYLGHYGIFERLLEMEPDVRATGGLFWTALQAACAAGHRKYAIELLGRGATVDAFGGLLGSPLQAALTGGYEDIVHDMRSKGARYEDKTGSLWKQAWSQLGVEEKEARTRFEEVLKERLDFPPKLASCQQLLAAVKKRLLSLESSLESLHGRSGTYFDGVHPLTDLVVSRFAESDSLGCVNYLYDGLFWAGVVVLVNFQPSHLKGKLNKVVEIAARVYRYESIAHEGSDRAHNSLQHKVSSLCFALLKIQVDSSSLMSGKATFGLRAILRARGANPLSSIDRLQELDKDCKTQVQSIRLSRAVATEHRVTEMSVDIKELLKREIADQMKDLRSFVEDTICREMQKMRFEVPQAIASQLPAILEGVNQGLKRRAVENEPDSTDTGAE